MSKYILVTGGTGFVGSHLIEKLLNLNKKVIILKRSFSNTWRIDEFLDNENLIIKDVDKENVNGIFSQFDVEGVFHLATFYQRNHDSEAVQKMIKTNITFPTELLENSINNNVSFFINTGTCHEYKLGNSPMFENSQIKPFNLYASTKIAFESILKFYSYKFNLNCSTLKLFTPYGPKDNENKITPYLIINSIKKNNILIKSPNKKLDFIFVKDVIDSYIATMNSICKLKEYNSFNIGTGIGTNIKDVLRIIEDNLGKNTDVSYENDEDDEVWCSNEKIKSILNWEPKTKLDEGIKLTIDYYKQAYGN